jgi:hypothetical protein
VDAYRQLLEMPNASAATVHRHLEREYRLLGDLPSSLRHGELADRSEAVPGDSVSGP